MSEKKRVFMVTVGIGGCIRRPVDAETKDDAIAKFFEDFGAGQGILDPGFELDWEFDTGFEDERVEVEDETPDA